MKAPYHHGDLRKALIERGLKLLAKRTADELSLREVARDVGVSPTAVYRHFPDKRALMAALAQEGLARLAAAQRAAAQAAGDGGAGFAATGGAYVRFALANPALFRLIFSTPSRPEAGDGGEREPSEAFRLLQANAAARARSGEGSEATQRIALHAWSIAHGLAMLMLDGQIPADERLIDLALTFNAEG